MEYKEAKLDYNDIKSEYNKLIYEGFILREFIYAYKNYLYGYNSPIDHKDKTNEETILELHKFDRFLLAAYPNLKDLKEIECRHIDNYKIFCISALFNTPITINKKIRAIRYFFDFLRKVKKLIEYNVALQVEYLDTEESKHPLHIPNSKLNILIQLLRETNLGIRDVCITKLLAYLGLRLNEIFEIKVDKVNLVDKEISVKRENSIVTFKIPEVLYVDLKEYKLSRNELANNNTDNIFFLSNSGNPYPVREYQRKFKLAVIDADFEESYTPRNVRATFAYHAAKTVQEETLKIVLNQDKVQHYYIDEI